MGGWLKFAQNVIPSVKGTLAKVLHKRFIFIIEKSVSITLKIVWFLRKAKKFYKKVKTTFVVRAYLVLRCQRAVRYNNSHHQE